MHLYVNSNQSHNQSSMGSFVSASFVSQQESVHDSLVFGKWLHLKGVCKHFLSSLTLPEIDSCQMKPVFASQIVSGLPVHRWIAYSLPCNTIAHLRELCSRSLLWWINQAAPWASSYRNSVFLNGHLVSKKSHRSHSTRLPNAPVYGLLQGFPFQR